jgi:hypothetical protein
LKGPPADPAMADIWLKKINPSGCNANCPFTAANVENALAGYGVMPAPPIRAVSTSGAFSTTVGGKGALELTFGGKFGDYYVPKLIEDQLRSAGPGARSILHAALDAAI